MRGFAIVYVRCWSHPMLAATFCVFPSRGSGDRRKEQRRRAGASQNPVPSGFHADRWRSLFQEVRILHGGCVRHNKKERTLDDARFDGK